MAVDVSMLGCRLRLCGGPELVDVTVDHVRSRLPITVLSGNVHALNLTSHHPWLRDALEQADLVRMDGAGLAFGARLLGFNPPPRATWADFGWKLAARCAEADLSLYLLGARCGVGLRAATRLRKVYPKLRVVGVQHGYFDHSLNSADSFRIITDVNRSMADILVVALGMPLQERWLRDHRHRIKAPVVMTAGGALDYLSGDQRRGPRWLTQNGLEWLARLAMDPMRLWRRYLVGNPRFVWRVLRERSSMGFGRSKVES